MGTFSGDGDVLYLARDGLTQVYPFVKAQLIYD